MLGRLDEAFASQRQFIQEASHELRNPLAVIRTNLEVTLADPDASTDDLRHTAEVVERSTERMTRLVDDLLRLRPQRDARRSIATPVDVAALVHEAADEFRAPAEARGLHHLLGGRARPARSPATATRCARRWPTCWPTPPDWRPTGTRRSACRAGREGPWVWMAVEDQGPGIAPTTRTASSSASGGATPAAGRARSAAGSG